MERVNGTPPPSPEVIPINSPVDLWARLVCLYIPPKDITAAYRIESVLTPEWVYTGGWEYLAHVVDVMLEQFLRPLGEGALPDLQWRVMPMEPPFKPKLHLPGDRFP
jgi:hypothetical protein